MLLLTKYQQMIVLAKECTSKIDKSSCQMVWNTTLDYTSGSYILRKKVNELKNRENPIKLFTEFITITLPSVTLSKSRCHFNNYSFSFEAHRAYVNLHVERNTSIIPLQEVLAL